MVPRFRETIDSGACPPTVRLLFIPVREALRDAWEWVGIFGPLIGSRGNSHFHTLKEEDEFPFIR